MKPVAARLCFGTCLLFSWVLVSMAKPFDAQSARDNLRQAERLLSDGNFKEAATLYRRAFNDAEAEKTDVVAAMKGLEQCRNSLGTVGSIDADLKMAIDSHPESYHVYSQAASQLRSTLHYGVIADQEFNRGYDRGYAGRGGSAGQIISVSEQDQLQAMQWQVKALELAGQQGLESDSEELGQLHLQLANIILSQRTGRFAWQLTELTDLTAEPNYLLVDGDVSSPARYAPTNSAGEPITYSIPESWDAAKSDGERLRWAIEQATKSSKTRSAAQFAWAEFLHSQFSVQTLADQRWIWRAADDDQQSDADLAQAAVHTLAEDEFLAQLASGVERFKLPVEQNYIRLYESVIADETLESSQASWNLIQVFLDRRQYPRAAELLKQHIERFDAGDSRRNSHELLDSIVEPQARFDMLPSQLAGQPAEVSLLFRNATQVQFTARQVDLEQLLAATKDFVRGLPQSQRRGFAGIRNVYMPGLSAPSSLFDKEQIDKFLMEEAKTWEEQLTPRDNHWDKRVVLQTPLETAGLYVVDARTSMPGSDKTHLARCLVWIQNAALVRHNLGEKWLYTFLDAKTGQPIDGANVEFFGYGQRQSQQRARENYDIVSRAERTNASGQVTIALDQDRNGFNWLTFARANDGRFALLDFESTWMREFYSQSYDALKAFGVSDRPIYRPGDELRSKFWLGHTTYGDERPSMAAGQKIKVILVDPQGNHVQETQLTTDEFGGCEFSYDLPKSTPLGRYWFTVTSPDERVQYQSSLSVRVEEYRKPEFEVNIQAPEKPVALGETIKARIEARYYFGAPVVDADVIVRVERSTHQESYYPPFPFDWCYGPGYAWLGGDYSWYPGWNNWRGCLPVGPIWPRWGNEPAELVLEKELKLNPEGEALIEIDTAIAKALYGDEDHRYQISVEVRDASRRTITASGSVLATSQAFRIYTWLDQGFYRSGEKVVANVQARMLDGTPVTGSGKMDLLRIRYAADGAPQEQVVAAFDVATNAEGYLQQEFVAAEAGQFRLRTRLDDGQGHVVEGGHIFTVRGDDMAADEFRYSGIELIPERVHYAPGDRLQLQITADYADAVVQLFVRPESGVYSEPKLVRLDGKSSVVEIPITEADQPNFFVEAYTVYEGELHRKVQEIYVPPAKRVLNVELETDKEEYQPGELAQVKLFVKDLEGKPVVGSVVIAAYDRALEALAGDVLPPDIREFFWKWQRHHNSTSTTNLDFQCQPINIQQIPYFQTLGIFGDSLADDLDAMPGRGRMLGGARNQRGMGGGFGGVFGGMGGDMAMAMAAPMAAEAEFAADGVAAKGMAAGEPAVEAPTIRQDFADAALWLANVTTDSEGKATAEFAMPDNLTSWQLKSWAVGKGTRVGSAETRAVTSKPLMVRLQIPRFLVQGDEVVISSLVNNDLDENQTVRVALQVDGETQFTLLDGHPAEQSVEVTAGGQARVDWRCRALAEGKVVLRTTAISPLASDGMQLELPILVRGLLKTDAYAGTVRQGTNSSTANLTIPADRRVEQSKLTVRVSPSLAASMLDALPYLAAYPYECTEQTLNRFLPTVVTHQTLREMDIDLKRLADKRRNNLNAQQLGTPAERREQWKIFDREAVFDEDVVAEMTREGVRRLTELQLPDGSWGWFGGTMARSSAHMTAIVVRGLLVAQENEVAIVPDVLQRGIQWLENYQTEQLAALTAESDAAPNKRKAQPDNIDALVFHTLVLAERENPQMQGILYDKRNSLSVYGKSLLAWATHQLGNEEQTSMLRRNLEQFLIVDEANQTAFLDDESPWWYWYGSNIEANAFYLKLLAAQEPKGEVAPMLVKYLLNNRQHAVYWDSTRDTALVVEAFSDYLRSTGELKPNMTVEVSLGGKRLGQVQFTAENLFDVNNTIEITGGAVPAGSHELVIRRSSGSGNVYWNAYSTHFTLEEEITPAGLEVAIERRYYLMLPEQQELELPDANAQSIDRQRLTYRRVPLEDLTEVPSGSLVEVELLVQSRNDYEYLLIEDRKPAGLEAVESQSGYFYAAGLGIYRELRDTHVGLFVERLPKGNYSIRYQLRSEAPGVFTGLPATIEGMYAPELVGNSADYDLKVVEDRYHTVGKAIGGDALD